MRICSKLTHVGTLAQLDFLGCGSQGFTVLAVDTLRGDEVAIKVLRCNDHVPPLTVIRLLTYCGMHACGKVPPVFGCCSQGRFCFAEYTAY